VVAGVIRAEEVRDQEGAGVPQVERSGMVSGQPHYSFAFGGVPARSGTVPEGDQEVEVAMGKSAKARHARMAVAQQRRDWDDEAKEGMVCDSSRVVYKSSQVIREASQVVCESSQVAWESSQVA
jgi:hypothetical protein